MTVNSAYKCMHTVETSFDLYNYSINLHDDRVIISDTLFNLVLYNNNSFLYTAAVINVNS